MTPRIQKDRAPAPGTDRVYELEVCLMSGPLTGEFAEENPIIARTIQIRGDQTLEQLHDAIFDAFERFDAHMYEFQVGGKGPMDPKARRYALAMGDEPLGDREPAGEVTRTTIDDLGLKIDEAFGYWFDFGDDWWHQVTVIAIHDRLDSDEYPRVTATTGDSPPQYADWDEEEE